MSLRTLMNNLRWILLAAGLLCLWAAAALPVFLLRAAFAILGIALLALAVWLIAAYSRPNRARVEDGLKLESWDVVSNELHNSNTDMLNWNGTFYLVHAVSPFHFASQKCRLVLLCSADARHWEKISEFGMPGQDIRDPKLAVIHERLFLYALINTAFNPEPYTTVFTSSPDGRTWEPLQKIQPEGWLFWRPKTRDGITWYVPAYWWEHGKSELFTSPDGANWTRHARIFTGDRNDETDIEFLEDGRMIATARLEFSESIFGDPKGSTGIAVAAPPYVEFQVQTIDPITRLDGPFLFRLDSRIYGVGRYQPEIGGPFLWQGSAFSRKRTSLFRVLEDGLVYISDLPSAGDTSYSGVVMKDGDLYVCYYTSDTGHDYPWIVGMLNASPIKMARINLACLEAVAEEKVAARKS